MIGKFAIRQQVRIRIDANLAGMVNQTFMEDIRDRRVVGVIGQYDPDPQTGLDALVNFEGYRTWFDDEILEPALDGLAVELVTEKSRDEIEKLKADWVRDSCWDIENTEGFEAHRDELIAFHRQKETEWNKAHMTRLVEAIQHTDAEMRLFDEVGDRSGWGRTNVVAALGELILRSQAKVIAALNAYEVS